MKLRIEIHTDNAAFEDNPNELGDILRHLGSLADDHASLDRVPVHDSNGNRVGLIETMDGKPCDYCDGSGIADGGVDGVECPDCNGCGVDTQPKQASPNDRKPAKLRGSDFSGWPFGR